MIPEWDELEEWPQASAGPIPKTPEGQQKQSEPPKIDPALQTETYRRRNARWASEEERLRRRVRLAHNLNDERKLLLAIRYYEQHLPIGEWKRLGPPRRQKSKKLNPRVQWRDHLTAARRLLGIRSRKIINEKGKRCTEYSLSREAWQAVQIRLAMDVPPRQGYTPAAQAFDDALLNPKTKERFRAVRADFKLNPAVQELAAELGAVLIERARSFLLKEIDPQTLAWYASERRRMEAAPTPEVKPAPAPKAKPAPSNPTVKQFAKAFLNKAQYPSEW